VAPPPEAGPLIVLIVAGLWSVTAACDKLGISAGPSLWAYCLAQRLYIGALCAAYLAAACPGAGRHVRSHWVLLMAVSILELGAVVFFLEAIDNLFVSYVVAIKRTNVLFSTVAGHLLFGEAVGRRIPYILLMLCGMLLIVMQPGHEGLHHNHRTKV
jgi:drug/metabolite transporter (DMT)-like permease